MTPQRAISISCRIAASVGLRARDLTTKSDSVVAVFRSRKALGFSQPTPFTFGNTSRNLPDVRSPGVVNFDFSFTKITHIKERITLQFRDGFFNGFNHPNFGSPGTTFGTANFGVISSAADPRIVQFGVKLLF